MDKNVLEIRPSEIHGNGLFSKIHILTGTKICKYYGRTITRKEFDLSGIKRFYYLGHKYVILANEEPYLSMNPVNFINEGDEPNVILKKRELFSIRDIKPGDELLLRYPDKYERDWLK